MNKKSGRGQSAVSTVIFASSIVVLVIIAGVGYGLYGMAVSNHSTMTETTSGVTESMTTTEMVNRTNAYAFTGAKGAMINNAWVLAVPIGMREYAVSVHAEELESNATYIVEGTLASGTMQSVLISSESMTMNTTTASEFRSNSNGTGLYWIVLGNDPAATFENIQLYFLPEAMMANATLVATVTFEMMSESTTTSSK